MSRSDTIDAITKERSSVERELRWPISALPAIVSTELEHSPIVLGHGLLMAQSHPEHLPVPPKNVYT